MAYQRFRLGLVLLAATALVSVSACSSGGSSSSSSQTKAPASSDTTAAAASGQWWQFKVDTSAPLWGMAAVKPNKKFKIGVAHVALNDQYYVALHYGIETQAKANGLTISKVVSAGGYDHLVDQVRQIEDLTASDVDVIIVLAASEEGTREVIDRAVAAGKKVISMVSVTASQKVYAQVEEDYSYAGQQQALYMCDHLKDGDTVAMLAGPAGASWSMSMDQGFKDTLKSKCPGVKIVAEQNSPIDPVKAVSITEDFLQRYPNLSGAFSVADVYARGAVSALDSAKKLDKVIVTTQGFTPWSKEALTKKQIEMAASNAPIIVGRWSVEAAIHAMNGDPGPGVKVHLTAPMPPVTQEDVAAAREVPEAGAFTPPGYSVSS